MLCKHRHLNSLVYSECFDPWFPSSFVCRVVSMAKFGNSAESRGKFGSQWFKPHYPPPGFTREIGGDLNFENHILHP